MPEKYELEPFQERGVQNLSISLSKNNSCLAVSPGGSGKAIIIATVAHRYILNSNKDVTILVHKQELLDQIRKHIFNWYGIISQKVNSKTTHIDSGCRVFVGMVETFDRRSVNTSFTSFFSNTGLLIFDEAHLSNFNKIIVHFPTAKRLGFTATPLSAVKTEPLNKYYQDIVIISTPSQLIELNQLKPNRGIVPCIAYSLQNVDRNKLKKKGNDFDEEEMGKEFSNKQQIQNVINAIITKAYGKKILIFNASMEHSVKMHQALLDAGFNSRNLNGKTSNPLYKKYSGDEYRKNTLEWFDKTPNAILNNIGILTTGFDCPSAEVGILNSSMMSLTLHIQKMVRVARPHIYEDGTYKEFGLILDMGNNIPHDGGNLKDYNYDWDWKEIFNNPKKKLDGVSPVKSCPECGALNPVSARICEGKVLDWLSDDTLECGYEFPVPKQVEDLIPKEMVRISSTINVQKNIDFFKDRSEFYSYFQIIKQIATNAKKEYSEYLDSKTLNDLFSILYDKCSEWYKIKSRKRPSGFREDLRHKLVKELKEFDFIIPLEEIEEFIT